MISSKAKIYSIEIDDSLYQNLEEKFGKFENWKLVKEDALNLPSLRDTSLFREATKLVGNLPYNISKKIIRNFLESKIQTGIFLIQKEVAEDYVAQVPNSTFLSNMVQAFGNCEYLFQVPKEYFYPVPKVDGGLIKITKNEILNIKNCLNIDSDCFATLAMTDDQKFIKFIHAMFASPRKTLANNLKNYLNSIQKDLEKAQVEKILTRAEIKLNARAQEVEFEKMRLLFEIITER